MHMTRSRRTCVNVEQVQMQCGNQPNNCNVRLSVVSAVDVCTLSHTLDRRTGTICTWRNSLSCPHPESIASYHNFRAHHNLNNMRQCHGFHVSFIDGRLVSSHGVMDSIREYYVFCFLIFYMEICLLSTGTDAYRDSA
jgi:hypothetical protein